MAGLAPIVGGSEHRVLRYAVLISIGIHLLLLFGLPAIEQHMSRAPAPPIQGRIAEAPPAPKVEEPPKPLPFNRPVPPKPEAAARAEPSVAPRAPDPLSERPASPTAPTATVAPAPPSPAASSAPVDSKLPALPREEASDARSLGEYRLEVIAAARRDKELNKERYSRIARATQWTGRVVIGVAIATDGKVQVTTRKSSGHRTLDQQAVEMFGQAVRSVRVPEALRGKAFDFEVTALFELED